MRLGAAAQKISHPRPTGTERYSLDILQALLRSKEADDELILYLQAAVDQGRWPGAALRLLRPPRLWTLLALSIEMLRRPPELLYIPSDILPLFHPRSVVVIHDVAFRFFPEAYPPLARLRLEWGTRRAVRRSSRIIAVSEATRRDLIEHFGADPAKVVSVLSGPNELAPPASTDLLRRYRLEPGRYFLFVGRIETKKNLTRLVSAFNAFHKAGHDGYRLVLAGRRGVGADAVEALVTKLSLEGDVVMPGFVTDAERSRLLVDATALILPSLSEGFGLPILEGFAASVPVIASDVSSLPEVGGEAALYFPPEETEALRDLLARVASDEELRADLVDRGKKQLKKFSWEKAARKTWKVLREAAK